MSQNFENPNEITIHHEPSGDKSRIWKTTIILSVLTIIELSLGFVMYFNPNLNHGIVIFIKGVIVILTLAKAGYIISIFMHLGDEIRNLIMTMAMPILLFVWFIAAFLWDGNSYRTLRNRYDPYYRQTTLTHEVRSADTARGGLQ